MRPSPQVLDHAEHPRNAGSFPANTQDVATGVARGDNAGDLVTLQLRVAQGVILEARFRAFGCSSTIAAASRLTEVLGTVTIDEALAIDANRLASDLALADDKLHAARLAVAALREAISVYTRAPTHAPMEVIGTHQDARQPPHASTADQHDHSSEDGDASVRQRSDGRQGGNELSSTSDRRSGT